MKMKSMEPTARHLRIRDNIIDAIRKDMVDMPADEILAVVSYTVGQLVAMQDQRKMTPDMAMQIVADNIEAGNAYTIKQAFAGTDGKAAQ